MADWDYPFNAFRSAVFSVFGWTALVPLAWMTGLWAGLMIVSGSFRDWGFAEMPMLMFASLLAWMAYPQILLGHLVTGVVWCVGLYDESARARLGGLAVVCITWLLLTCWVFGVTSH